MSQSANSKRVGIIAGTGFYNIPELVDRVDHDVRNDYGSARITTGTWNGVSVVFLTRHGSGHTIPPHMINFRANIKALKDAGVSHTIAVSVVGGVDPTLKAGDLSLIDDFVDFTSGREHTFFDGTTPEGVQHVDVTYPYDRQIQSALRESAKKLSIPLREKGIYAGFNGPRFETPAEVRFAALAGATVVGMTGCPEVSLAKEANLPYATIALIVNPAAGLSEKEITIADINAALDIGREKVLAIISGALPLLSS